MKSNFQTVALNIRIILKFFFFFFSANAIVLPEKIDALLVHNQEYGKGWSNTFGCVCDHIY